MRAFNQMWFFTLALPAGFIAGMLLTGCGHSNGGSPSISNSPPTITDNLTSVTDDPSGGSLQGVKAGTQFLQAAASGNLAAAHALENKGSGNLNGDPTGEVASLVKVNGSITDIKVIKATEDDGELHVTGVLSFANSPKMGFVLMLFPGASSRSNHPAGPWTIGDLQLGGPTQ